MTVGNPNDNLLLSFRDEVAGGERAIVDIAKLRDYCLNPAHPRGRHKARVFASTLGLTQADAEFLCAEVLRAAREANAAPGDGDEYGQRYTVDFELTRGDPQATVLGSFGPASRFRSSPVVLYY